MNDNEKGCRSDMCAGHKDREIRIRSVIGENKPRSQITLDSLKLVHARKTSRYSEASTLVCAKWQAGGGGWQESIARARINGTKIPTEKMRDTNRKHARKEWNTGRRRKCLGNAP